MRKWTTCLRAHATFLYWRRWHLIIEILEICPPSFRPICCCFSSPLKWVQVKIIPSHEYPFVGSTVRTWISMTENQKSERVHFTHTIHESWCEISTVDNAILETNILKHEGNITKMLIWMGEGWLGEWKIHRITLVWSWVVIVKNMSENPFLAIGEKLNFSGQTSGRENDSSNKIGPHLI